MWLISDNRMPQMKEISVKLNMACSLRWPSNYVLRVIFVSSLFDDWLRQQLSGSVILWVALTKIPTSLQSDCFSCDFSTHKTLCSPGSWETMVRSSVAELNFSLSLLALYLQFRWARSRQWCPWAPLPSPSLIFAPRGVKMLLYFATELASPELGFLGGSDSKESAWHKGDSESASGSGRCPGAGNDNPPQCSCLENPVD